MACTPRGPLSDLTEYAKNKALTVPVNNPVRTTLPVALGAAALLAVCVYCGLPQLQAFWRVGDEHKFLVNNPLVTGEDGRALPLRMTALFATTHEDLYQPLPLVSYAIDWAVWPEDLRPLGVRSVDLGLHALDALLVWWVLSALLWRAREPDDAGTIAPTAIAWALALLWAAHPANANAYAADMGRTHLLAAAFALASLIVLLRGLARPSLANTVSSVALFAAALLCKPLVAWPIIVAGVIVWRAGWRRLATSGAFYAILTLTIAAGAFNFELTERSGLISENENLFYGDPLTRALTSTALYVRDTFRPTDALGWDLLSPAIGWSYSFTQFGLGLVFVGAVLCGLALTFRRTRLVGLGLIWYAASLGPVLGIVGVRVFSVSDKYLYLPLVGLALALGALLQLAIPRHRPRRTVLATLVAGAAGITTLVWLAPETRERVVVQRSTLRQFQILADRNPKVASMQEFLARAFDYVRRSPQTPARLANPNLDYASLTRDAFRNAAAMAHAYPESFPTDDDRLAFHRRMSFEMLNLGMAVDALAAARAGLKLAPDDPILWMRVAHAQRAMQDWQAALDTYAEIEQRFATADPQYLALRLTEFGTLLMNVFDRADRALQKLRAARDTGAAPLETMAALARAEVLAGKGIDGFNLAREVLARQPDNFEVKRIIALYHLRSEHYDEADRWYRGLLAAAPTDFELLRGFQSLCERRGDLRDAAFAWQDALERDPENLTYRAFFVWSAALAGEPQAAEWARQLLADAPDNRFAHFALMLDAAHRGDWVAAIDSAAAGDAGQGVPHGNETLRAAAALDQLTRAGRMPAETNLLAAELWRLVGNTERATRALAEAALHDGNDAYRTTLGRIRERLRTEQTAAD